VAVAAVMGRGEAAVVVGLGGGGEGVEEEGGVRKAGSRLVVQGLLVKKDDIENEENLRKGRGPWEGTLLISPLEELLGRRTTLHS
jgi:hypothetical protein